METTTATDFSQGELNGLRGLDEELRLDTSEGDPTCLLIGEGGAHIRVSPSVRQLLRLVKAGFSFQEIASEVSERQGRAISAEDLESAHREVVEKIRAIEAVNRVRPLSASFWLRLPLVSKEVVQRVSSYLVFAYQPRAAAILLTTLAILMTIFVVGGGLEVGLSPGSFWYGYGLFLLSLVAHEFGHSTACARYGAEPSDIGFTMYLIYPALYSDVTTAWRLSRWQRVVVDLGGNYFQFLAGGVLLILYFVTSTEAFRVGFVMILLGAAFSLNPVFKFDGYWMLSDALGVTNLGAQPGRIVSRLIRRFRGRPVDPLPWPRRVTVLLAVYTPLTFLFWGYFLWRLAPILWANVVMFPRTLHRFLTETVDPGRSISWLDLQQLLMSIFLLLVAYLLVVRLTRPFIHKLRLLRRV